MFQTVEAYIITITVQVIFQVVGFDIYISAKVCNSDRVTVGIRHRILWENACITNHNI